MEIDDINYYLRVLKAIAQRIETTDPMLQEFCQLTIAQAPYVLHAGDPPDQSALDRVVEEVMQGAPSVSDKPKPTPPGDTSTEVPASDAPTGYTPNAPSGDAPSGDTGTTAPSA